jgi:hypothetical protein
MQDETWQAAVAETNRLQRELDITNADHIALWIEANTIPNEPMNQCASWLACRIVEAHEAAMAERIAALEAEVARLQEAAQPFVNCCEFIADDEDDEEWAKFRLLVKDYRNLRKALENPDA